MIETSLSAREIIRRWLEKPRDSWHLGKTDKASGKPLYHASSVWMCHRQSIYERLGYPAPKPLGLFEMGRRVEAVLHEALSHHYGRRFVLNDVPCREEFPEFVIKGETDPVLMDWNLRPLIVYECKSSEFGAKTQTGEHHRRQACWYAHVIGAPEVRVVHAARSDVLDAPEEDTIIRGADIMRYADEARAYFRAFHEDVKRVAKDVVLPEPRPILKDACKWCSHRERCQTDGGWVQVPGRGGKLVWKLKHEATDSEIDNAPASAVGANSGTPSP